MPAKNALLYFDTVGESTSFSERRRSPRSLLDMPLVVRGLSVEKKPFREETFTISVNAHGALIALFTSVAVGQTLVLMDPQIGMKGMAESPVSGLWMLGWIKWALSSHDQHPNSGKSAEHVGLKRYEHSRRRVDQDT